MSKSHTFNVTVQVDVQNAEDIQQAREAVFSLLSAPKSEPKKTGRPSSSAPKPKATVTGIQIPLPDSPPQPTKVTVLPDVNVFSFTHPSAPQIEVTESSP